MLSEERNSPVSDPAAIRGCVLQVQRFCTQDGPGVRSTVFLKGCPLHCLWCANPESQSIHPQVGLDAALCRSCGACQIVCPTGAIEKNAPQHIDPARCIGCGRCASVCISGAIRQYGSYRTASDVFSEVQHDMAFYRRSGGGVTVSGGEPALQADFTHALLSLCRSEGIHTLAETAGNVPYAQLLSAVRLADEVYFDLKLASETLHRQYTGSSNAQILRNLRLLSEEHPAVTVRIPLIPTVNDDRAELCRIAEIIAGLPQVCRIGLLPYHAYGKNKYAYLGRPYALADLASPDESALRSAANLLAEKTGKEVLLKI